MPTALILTNGPMGIRNHHQVDKLRALLMAGAILAGCVREPYQIGRKDPSPCSASAEHRLYVDMVWIVENARSRSLCVRYSTPDTPGGGRAGIAVELDRYKFPEGNSLQHKTWVAATQPQAYDLGTVKSVYKTGELCGAGITDGPLAIVKNWRTSGPVVGLCKSDCFTPIRQFGPWDSPVFLDGHTAIIEIPVRHPSTAPTQGFQYKYVRIDSSGRQSAISVPDGTQHLHSNGQVHLAIGEWGTIALNDSGQELWHDSTMKFNEFEDDGITPRDSFVLQRASGFEVHEFSTNRVGFSAENCQARQVCSAGNIVAVTGLDAKATYVERAKDLTLWIVQDGSLATKIPRAGYLPQVLRTGQNPVVSADNSVFISPNWNHRQARGLPYLLIDCWLLSDDALDQHLTIERLTEGM